MTANGFFLYEDQRKSATISGRQLLLAWRGSRRESLRGALNPA
jgi:hypothetical protein